ncbi:MAG TPA: pyruvate ferredoxin oxidoreductase, partial [bacterium]|nr:pyruvate ferredoxin oxidoreductase [bacterium]
MPVNIKELSGKEDRLTGGHRLCAGCGASIAVRQILLAIDKPVVVANATGCLEVATTIYPYTAWKTPWIHSAFENAAATISGVEAAYQSLKRQGKITDDIA